MHLAKCENCGKFIDDPKQYTLMGTMAFGRQNVLIVCLSCLEEMQKMVYSEVVAFCEERRKHLQFKEERNK